MLSCDCTNFHVQVASLKEDKAEGQTGDAPQLAQLPFKGSSWDSHATLSLASHWLLHGHKAKCSCKAAWDMYSKLQGCEQLILGGFTHRRGKMEQQLCSIANFSVSIVSSTLDSNNLDPHSLTKFWLRLYEPYDLVQDSTFDC